MTAANERLGLNEASETTIWFKLNQQKLKFQKMQAEVVKVFKSDLWHLFDIAFTSAQKP